jgi:nuclear GTP-binding protein
VFDEAPTGEPSAQENSILLRNVLRPQDIPDPLAVVRAILARAGPDALQRIYGLPEFATADELVAMLALKGGRLGKVHCASPDHSSGTHSRTGRRT